MFTRTFTHIVNGIIKRLAKHKGSIFLPVDFVFVEKLLNSEGRELRRALFSLKQIFQVMILININIPH